MSLKDTRAHSSGTALHDGHAFVLVVISPLSAPEVLDDVAADCAQTPCDDHVMSAIVAIARRHSDVVGSLICSRLISHWRIHDSCRFL
jgi:hypothetical protein